MKYQIEWQKANTRCTFNVDGPVYVAHVNGVALFVWQVSEDWWNCAVTGQLTTGGRTRESAQISGEQHARNLGTKDADKRLSKAELAAIAGLESR